MKRRTFLQAATAALPALDAWAGQAPATVPVAGPAEAPPPIALPKPQTTGGKPLMQAISERKTTREISEERLPLQTLSNLLWAAFGVNRPATSGRTAPSARGVKDIDIYVFLPEGVYLFDAAAHGLTPVLSGDKRAKTGGQPGVAQAPVNLVYVADAGKYKLVPRLQGREDLDAGLAALYSHSHVGFMGQNAYLYAASEGLASWFRASIDAANLASLLKLRPTQKVLYAQTFGYPKNKA